MTVGSFTTEYRVALLRLIASLDPSGLDRIQLYSGGAEAVEAAVRLAKAVHQKVRDPQLLGRVSRQDRGRSRVDRRSLQEGLGPAAPGASPCSVRRLLSLPVSGWQYPGCGLFCLEFVRKVIENNTAGSLAAIHRGAHAGNGRAMSFRRPSFSRALWRSPGENDALLIADEMITGFGRTGRMFGSSHTDLTPDIMTIGKGMGNGFPISGLVSTD